MKKELTVICDKKGRVVSMGPGAQEFLGPDAASAFGRNVTDLLGSIDDADADMASALKSAFKSGGGVEKGFQFRTSEGMRRMFDLSLAPLESGSSCGNFILTIKNTTDFVRLEEILEQYAEGLTILYEISNDFLSKTGMVDVMRGALDMIKAHYGADEVQVMAPRDGSSGMQLELTAASTGSSVKHGERVPLIDNLLAGNSFGNLCPVVVADFDKYDGIDGAEFVGWDDFSSGIAVPMAVEGRCFGVLSILYKKPRALDTAELWYLNVLANSLAVYIEKERSLDSLSKSERFLNSVLEGIGEGVLVIAPDMRILSANKRYLDFVGRELDDVVGRHCYETSHNREMPCAEYDEDCTVKKVFETGVPHSSLHTHTDKNGRKVYVRTSSYPIFGPDGKEVDSVVETMMNMTDSIQLEKDLEKRVQELEDFYDMAVGRELRMIELKDEIDRLREELARCREK